MRAVHTLSALGHALGQEIPALARAAHSHLTVRSSASRTDSLRALEVLLDRLCLSLSLAKPVGLIAWAERESPRCGRGAVVDMMSGATQAIASASASYRVERTRLLAFLDVLAREVEQAVLGIPSPDPRDPIDVESAGALLAMLGERDFGTCCHSKATGEWARRLARALDCENESIEFIALCALLHDIGKIATPDSVLLKPSSLDAQEWAVMRDHAAAGARILNQIPSLQRCALIVRAHHERFDGTGYPDGLAGTSIPFEARIVAVADAFHAMISDRPYRTALAPRTALAILQEGRGSQWDPQIVDAMVGMFGRRAPVHVHEQVSSA
jgi:putative nucleotidyltransferase with HDIG domain